MERIAIAMRDGGAGAGVRHEGGARAARLTSFCLAAEPLWGPPGRGTFWFQIFIQAYSSEIWRKTIFGGERGCSRGSGVACFGATSLEKIICGVIAIISFRPGGCSSLPCRVVLSFRSEAREALGSETARVHHAAR